MIEKKVPEIPTKTVEKQFEKTDLDTIRGLQSKLDEITIKLGQISIQKIQLENAESELKSEFFKTQAEETKLAKTLSDKYGVGTLDIESGKFTPQS
jgi:hypothetical protein